MLKEVVQKMSGVESNDDITPQQLEALSGGEMIKSEVKPFKIHVSIVYGNLNVK